MHLFVYSIIEYSGAEGVETKWALQSWGSSPVLARFRAGGQRGESWDLPRLLPFRWHSPMAAILVWEGEGDSGERRPTALRLLTVPGS